MKISISHQTEYRYSSLTKNSIQYIRAIPQNLPHQRVISWQLSLPRIGSEFIDGFGNICTTVSLRQPHNVLRLTAEGEVEIVENIDWIIDNRLPPEIFCNQSRLTECDDAMRAFAKPYVTKPSRKKLKELAAALLDKMPYTPGKTKADTPAKESFAMGEGVCQDHSHVFISMLRDAGIPARYVSGYLYIQSDDHLASHAWTEAFLGDRWYVFDVSNQFFRPSQHVQTAIGLDYYDAAPVRGMRQGGGIERMNYHVLVQAHQSQQ